MRKNEFKETYEAPIISVIRLESESIMAASTKAEPGDWEETTSGNGGEYEDA